MGSSPNTLRCWPGEQPRPREWVRRAQRRQASLTACQGPTCAAGHMCQRQRDLDTQSTKEEGSLCALVSIARSCGNPPGSWVTGWSPCGWGPGHSCRLYPIYMCKETQMTQMTCPGPGGSEWQRRIWMCSPPVMRPQVSGGTAGVPRDQGKRTDPNTSTDPPAPQARPFSELLHSTTPVGTGPLPKNTHLPLWPPW